MPKVLYRQYSVIQISCSCSFRRKSILVSPTGKSHVPVHLGGNLTQSAPQGKLMFLFIHPHGELSCGNSHVTIHVGGNLYQRAPCGKSRITVHLGGKLFQRAPCYCSFREEICTREPHVGNLMLLFIQGEICSREPHVVKSSFVHCLRQNPGTTADQQGVTIFKMKIMYVNVIFFTSTTQCEYIK